MFSQVNITAGIQEDASYYDYQQILSKIVDISKYTEHLIINNLYLKFNVFWCLIHHRRFYPNF